MNHAVQQFDRHTRRAIMYGYRWSTSRFCQFEPEREIEKEREKERERKREIEGERERTMIIFYSRAVFGNNYLPRQLLPTSATRKQKSRPAALPRPLSRGRPPSPGRRVRARACSLAVYGMGSTDPKQPLIRPFCEIATLTIFQTPFRRRADVSLSILSSNFFSPFFPPPAADPRRFHPRPRALVPTALYLSRFCSAPRRRRRRRRRARATSLLPKRHIVGDGGSRDGNQRKKEEENYNFRAYKRSGGGGDGNDKRGEVLPRRRATPSGEEENGKTRQKKK